MSEAHAIAQPEAQLHVVVVDISAARRDMARDAADERLIAETQGGGRIKGLANRIWKGNIAHEYYRQKYTHEALGQIDQTQNLFINEDGQPSSETSVSAVVNRFANEFDDVIHAEAGEQRTLLDDPDNEAGNQVKSSIKELLRAFAEDELDENNFEEEKNRQLKDLAASNPGLLGQGLLYADNLLEVAQNVKAAASHGRGVQEILDEANFTVGEAKMGARTEARFNATDKLIDKIHSTKVGSLANETTIATAAAVIAVATKFTTQKTIGAATAVTGIFGVGGAVIGGLRESKRIKEERTLHSREMATGKQFQPGAKRREELETARYESIAATDLTNSLRERLDENGKLSEVEPTDFLGLVGIVADATVRNRLSDRHGVDLVHFNDVTTVEAERLDLDVARIQVREALRERFDEKGADWVDGVQVNDFDELLELSMATYETSLEGQMQMRDQVFKKIHRNHVVKAAIIGGVIGASVAAGAQEAMAHLPGVGDQLYGIGEQPPAGNETSQTFLGGLIHREHGPANVVDAGHELRPNIGALSGETHDAMVGANHFTLPKEFNLQETSPGHWSIVDAEGKVSGAFEVGEDGQVSLASIPGLQEAGIRFDTTHELIASTAEVPTDANGLVQNHLAETKQVHRTLWYNNDTPQYDLNELRTYAAGVEGSWFDADGNVVLDVTPMIPNGGSFAGSESVNPFELTASGHLNLAISASRETQANVFGFDFTTTTDGRTVATIPAGSPVHQLFQMDGDQRVFNGGYFEVMENTGQTDEFGEQVKVLGTYVGTNNPNNLTDIVATSHDVVSTTVTMPAPVVESIPPPVETGSTYEALPIVPIRSRKGLEKMSRSVREYYGYGSTSPEHLRELEAERSPRLLRDPSAELNPEEELTWYRKLLKKKRGPEYMQAIDQGIIDSPELAALPAQTKAIVCIPVGAVGEADNIYKTLSLYNQQHPNARAQSTILLHVNWIDDQMNDPTKRASIEKTLAEVERARQDFPDLNIASFTTEWERDFVTRKNGIIGEVVRRLYDTALLSVDQKIQDGTISGTQDVLLIRNDADGQGMSDDYLGKMIDASSGGDSDAYVGAVRWETKTHRDYPGFGVVSNFREVMHAVAGRRGSTTRIPTIGINSAVRASSLAAVGSIGTGDYIGAGSDDLEIGNRIYAARDKEAQAYRRSRVVDRLLYGRRSGAGYSAVPAGSTARPIKYVTNAQIDTTGDRLLNIYRAGGSITDAWDSFDQGGYSDRNAGASNSSLIDQDDTGDINSVAQRIEQNISDMASRWFRDPAYVQTGIHFMFPEKTKSGEKVYDLSWTNGKCSFTLTDAGKQWLQDRLERDHSGRPDPFGTRVRRNLYQETTSGSTKQPNTNRPRFVEAQS